MPRVFTPGVNWFSHFFSPDTALILISHTQLLDQHLACDKDLAQVSLWHVRSSDLSLNFLKHVFVCMHTGRGHRATLEVGSFLPTCEHVSSGEQTPLRTQHSCWPTLSFEFSLVLFEQGTLPSESAILDQSSHI